MAQFEPPHKRYPSLAALVIMMIIATMLFLNPMGTISHAVSESYHWVVHLRVVERLRYDFSENQKGN
jgi:hypothetical protein